MGNSAKVYMGCIKITGVDDDLCTKVAVKMPRLEDDAHGLRFLQRVSADELCCFKLSG
jgi:hypothetical protein